MQPHAQTAAAAQHTVKLLNLAFARRWWSEFLQTMASRYSYLVGLISMVHGGGALSVETTLNRMKAAALSGICSVAICATPAPTLAAQPNMNDAIVEFSEAVHPILAVQNTAFPAFTEQVAALLFTSVEPSKLANSIEVSLDALNSVPKEKIADFNGVVKDAFAGLEVDKGCRLVPLPPKPLVDKVLQVCASNSRCGPLMRRQRGLTDVSTHRLRWCASQTEAVSLVDKGKLSAYGAAWGETYKLLPTDDAYLGPDGNTYSVMCLPPPAGLDKLALAQADIGRSIGAAELKRFKDTVPATLKAIRPTDAIPLAKTAERLAKIPPEQVVRLNSARKAVEKAAEAEAYKARLAEINARSAAAKSALQGAK